MSGHVTSRAGARLRRPWAGIAAVALMGLAGYGCGSKEPAQVKEGGQATKAAYDPKDLSGVYTLVGGLVFDAESAVDPSTQTGKPGGTGQVFGVGPNARQTIPYKPEYQALYEKTLLDRKNLVDDDYIADCIPYGFPRIVGGSPGPLEFIVKDDQVWIIYQYFQQIRRIYMNAEHKPAEERWPTYYGDSVGKWEGDTLVVDTVGSKAGRYDRTGAPYSDQTHSVERIRRIDADTIEDQITIEDPVMLAKPWVVTRHYKKQPPGTRMGEFYCEVNRNPIVVGKDGKPHQSVVLPSDRIPGVE